ncbi:hypothetical protein [Halomicrococcus sp. NG-SE-24]|uniref:hypothetical protein n=1 Tax=unclassified Halomicrococcus TaxID=2614448 RepID=UPI003D998BFF
MLRNRHGSAVDPVPFFVVAGLGLLVSFAVFPPTLAGLGVAIPQAFALSTWGFAAVAAGTYYYLVWTALPGAHGATDQLVGVGYGIVAVVALLAALSLAATH